MYDVKTGNVYMNSSTPHRCTFEYPSWANLCSPTLDCTDNLQFLKRGSHSNQKTEKWCCLSCILSNEMMLEFTWSFFFQNTNCNLLIYEYKLLICFEDPLRSVATILAKQKQVYSMGFYLIRCAIYIHK